MERTSIAELIGRSASADTAIGIFRDWLPEHGFKLVVPPPLAGRGTVNAFASAWRRGETRVVSHKGATATLALLRVAESELAKIHSDAAFATCRECRGLGWFVTNLGTIKMCSHTNAVYDANHC